MNFKKIQKKDALAVLNQLIKGDISISDGSGIISEFENNFSKYLGIKYSLAQNNGTSTIHSAFFALGLKKDDEVLVPAFTWHSGITPLLHLNLKPVFCEINPKTLTLDSKDLIKKINEKTKAILVTHLFGMPAEMDEIIKIKEKYGLKLVEDCSHAYGSEYKHKKVGNFGDISCFSMQGSKLLKAGEGGILCTNNLEYFEKALVFGHFGRLNNIKSKNLQRYKKTGLGFKYRPSPLSIALANSQLKRINVINKEINDSINYFENQIRNLKEIKLFSLPKYSNFRSYYGYRLLYNNPKPYLSKNKFINDLRDKKVIISHEPYELLHNQKVFISNDFSSTKSEKVLLPITEKIYSKIIYIDLPIGDKGEIDRIAKEINKILMQA
jgi:perosamine synthetase